MLRLCGTGATAWTSLAAAVWHEGWGHCGMGAAEAAKEAAMIVARAAVTVVVVGRAPCG